MSVTMERENHVKAMLFDRYSLLLSPELTYHADGQMGKRVFFISDPNETF